MFCICSVNPATLSVEQHLFTDKIESATKNLKTIVEDFVKENDGKLDSCYQEENFDHNKLEDGFYLVKIKSRPNCINVYKKSSHTEIQPGWITNSSLTTHNVEFIKQYSISKFAPHLINELIDRQNTPVQHKAGEKSTGNGSITINMDSVIVELIKRQFKPFKNKNIPEAPPLSPEWLNN